MSEDGLLCTICNDLFDQGGKCPLVLPCGHTFCRECTERLAASGRRECPNDKQAFLPSSGGVHNVPKNHALLRLIASQIATPRAAAADEVHEAREALVALCAVA